jgi:hypothetical protein
VNVNTAGGKPQWKVLTSDFREKLGSAVRPSDPIIRLGYTEGTWEVELKIPQKHIGQILSAYDYLNTDELDVDLLIRNDPNRTFKGKLHRDRIGGEAREHRDDNNEPEPVVYARIRVDGSDIAEEDQLPHNLLVTGVEVHAMIRCGKHRMGYSLFYGVWEFLYEKVVFLF